MVNLYSNKYTRLIKGDAQYKRKKSRDTLRTNTIKFLALQKSCAFSKTINKSLINLTTQVE